MGNNYTGDKLEAFAKTIDAFLVLVHEYLNLRLNTKTANIEAIIADSKCGQNEKNQHDNFLPSR